MANYQHLSNRFGQQFLVDGDTVDLLPGFAWRGGGDLIRPDDDSPDDIRVSIFGTLSASEDAIDFDDGGSGPTSSRISILVGRDAVISAQEDAISFAAGEGNAVVNHGTITAQDEVIASPGGRIHVENHGAMTVTALNGDEGFVLTASASLLLNTGTMTAISSSAEAAVSFDGASGGATIHNTGVISSSIGRAIATSGTVASDDVVTNAGLVLGSIETRGGADRFDNRGGRVAGSVGVGDGDDVVRAGIVTGDVVMGTGDDRFNGRRGDVAGEVRGGPGDDVYILDDADTPIVELAGEGSDTVRTLVTFSLAEHFEDLVVIGSRNVGGHGNDVANTIRGNAGDNALTGGAGDDVLDGRAGDDRMRGNAGSDVLGGGRGDDEMRGNRGDDTLEGGEGRDRLKGGSGDDVLDGGDARDRLDGGGGADRIDGGEGRDVLRGRGGADVLTGGEGDDRFVWRRVAEARAEWSDHDEVSDFATGEDRLDLRGMDLVQGDDVLAGRERELVVEVRGPDAHLLVDVDGDASADMTIVLRGVTVLGEGDLML